MYTSRLELYLASSVWQHAYSALVGEYCVVGNSCELKNVILFDHVQTPHYNYVGDSILGYYAHTGAGAITSNVKSDKNLVVVHDRIHHEEMETGLKKKSRSFFYLKRKITGRSSAHKESKMRRYMYMRMIRC